MLSVCTSEPVQALFFVYKQLQNAVVGMIDPAD